MNKIIFILCSGLLFFACRHGETQKATPEIEYRGDTLCLAANSNLARQIELLTVQPEPYSAELNTTGAVKAIPGQLAEIAPPFSGRVVKLFVQLGQRVSAGTPVFELSSGEFYEASKNYFQALQAKKMSENALRRQRDLVQHGVGVQKELEEAETSHEFAQRDYETVVAGLQIFNVDPDALVMGQPLKVSSPISGEVVQSNVVLGQYIRDDSPPLVIVAELSKVWVVAQVKEKYMSGIRADDRVEIRTEADTGHVFTGRVRHIGALLDEETRSVQVFVTCDNADRKLKPGMFVNVRFISAPEESVVIPAAAVLQTEQGSYVWVQAGRDRYVRRSVEVAAASHHDAVVHSGLRPGEVIIAGGGIYLMGI
ncbi:MAG: efflux RND transporter periplasmic adaptor subunit [Bacteroidales bacterium]|jgi:cobalt-zinc-cadmium efflux system membrane fusion protein|nr:efflux RND transporter periplasmic adaptor subunit [Bacteroidales bacterium]